MLPLLASRRRQLRHVGGFPSMEATIECAQWWHNLAIDSCRPGIESRNTVGSCLPLFLTLGRSGTPAVYYVRYCALCSYAWMKFRQISNTPSPTGCRMHSGPTPARLARLARLPGKLGPWGRLISPYVWAVRQVKLCAGGIERRPPSISNRKMGWRQDLHLLIRFIRLATSSGH